MLTRESELKTPTREMIPIMSAILNGGRVVRPFSVRRHKLRASVAFQTDRKRPFSLSGSSGENEQNRNREVGVRRESRPPGEAAPRCSKSGGEVSETVRTSLNAPPFTVRLRVLRSVPRRRFDSKRYTAEQKPVCACVCFVLRQSSGFTTI